MTAPATYSSARDLASRYNVSHRQIALLAEKGKIPGFKIGNAWRFDAEEVHKVLTTHTTNPFKK